MARTSTAPSDHAAVVAYYRAVGPTLLAHLAGRAVTGVGPAPVADRTHPVSDPSTDAPSPPAVERRRVALQIADLNDLQEAVRSGVVGFALSDWPGSERFALHVRAGQDSGIDVVATTALALMELLQTGGARVVAQLDGTGGMYLAGVGAAQPTAVGAAHALAHRSPEIATTNESDAAGRALVAPLPSDDEGLPAPYSLVPGPDGPAPVTPLTRDEVAAATAGMPLDVDRADVVDRIRTRGDLALPLAGRGAADA